MNDLQLENTTMKNEIEQLKNEIKEIKHQMLLDKINMKIKDKFKLRIVDEIEWNGFGINDELKDVLNEIRIDSVFSEGTNSQNSFVKPTISLFKSKNPLMKISTPFDLKKFQLIKKEEGLFQLINSNIQYCEVELKGKNSIISIGLVKDMMINKERHVGWDLGTIGFHSDDGMLFNQNTKGDGFDQPYNEGDIIGCGYIPSTKSIFYTRNGNLVKIIPNEVIMNHFAIGLESYESVLINTGEKPFKFDLIGFNNQFNNKEGQYYRTFTVNCDLFIFEMKMNLFVTLKEIKELLIDNLLIRITSNDKLNIFDKYYQLVEMYWNESIVDGEEIDNVFNLRNRIEYNGWYECSIVENVLKTTNQIEMKFQTHKQQSEIEEKRIEEIRLQRELEMRRQKKCYIKNQSYYFMTMK